MLMLRRSRVWSGFLLAALLLSLLGTLVTPSPARAGTDPPEYDDELRTPLTVEVSMAELPSVGKSAEVTIVVSSTERADGVQVGIVGSDGLRIDGERELVIDLAAGESRTLSALVTPEVAGNHTVAANVSLDFGDGNGWGDSDGVYFFSGDGSASEGFRYMGDPMAGEAAPGPGNTMEFESEAFSDGSMPAIPTDEDVEVPVDKGEPGGEDDVPREGDIAAATGMLAIRGNVGVTHRDGTWKPQKLLVELLSSRGEHIAFTYSDFNGHYVFNVGNPGRFRIRVRAYYRHTSMSIGAIRVVLNGFQTSSKFSLAGWNYSLPVMGPFSDGEIFVGTWRPSPTWSGSRAWWVYQDLMDGFFSTWNQTPPGAPAGSRQPDGVTVEWQPGSTVHPHYNHHSRRVKLKDIDANTHSTPLHEYGHAVMHNVYGTLPPIDCPSQHSIEKVSATNCAWLEGWADFFSIYVAGNPIYTHGCALPCTPSGAANLEMRLTFPVPWDQGDLVEGNIAASLWDFVDARADGSDKTDPTITPFWKIWDVVYNHNHNNFFEFWDTWSANVNYTVFAQSLATLYQNTIDYGWPAVCGDYSNEGDDAVPWTFAAYPADAPYPRYFCTDHDVDWYKLEVVAGETYVIETANLSTALNGSIADTTLTLYRQDPNTYTQLAYDDNGGSENLASRIVYTASAGGELLVAVRQRYGLGNPFYYYTIDVSRVTNNVAPTVTAPTQRLFAGQTLGNPEAAVYTVDVKAEWTASDPDDGIAFQSLQAQVDDGGFVVVEPSISPNVRAHIVPVRIGATNQLQVSATDTYGASSGYATGASFELLGIQDTDFTYEGVWTNKDAEGAWGGSYMSTDGSASPMIADASSTPAVAYATATFTGVSMALVGMTASDGGRAEIYIDGELQGLADFYSASEMSRQVVFAVNDLSAGAHQLEVRWVKFSNEGSSGFQLYLDGVIALD